MADIVIFGASPVALASAWALKLKYPDVEVHVYGSQQCSAILSLDHLSFKSWLEAANITDKDWLAITEELSQSTQIQHLYSRLSAAVQQAGIHLYDESKSETAQSVMQIAQNFPDLKLILCADGINGAATRNFFGEKNAVKFASHYLLTLDFVDNKNRVNLEDVIVPFGVTAHERINTSKSVQLDILLPEQAYRALSPLHVNTANFSLVADQLSLLPPGIAHFIQAYLGNKHILLPEVTFNTKEAPLTRAESVTSKTDNNIPVVLLGGAALNLSIATLSVGLQQVAMLLNHLPKDNQIDNLSLTTFKAYQADFKKFADRKCAITQQGITYYARQMSGESPVHRAHPIETSAWAPKPFKKLFKDAAKLFTTLFTPYKSPYHIRKDGLQPVTGLSNMGLGFVKIFHGIGIRQPRRSLEGVMSLTLGLLQFVLSPLTLVIKIPVRMLHTAYFKQHHHDKGPLIENNPGLQRVALAGLAHYEATALIPEASLFILKQIADDLNRKRIKSEERNQASDITAQSAQTYRQIEDVFNEDDINTGESRHLFLQYFSMFTQPTSPLDSKVTEISLALKT